MTIGRYAMTIGAADPSHYDPAAGRPGTPTSWRHRTCSRRSSSGVSAPPRHSFSPTEPRTTETCPSVTATWTARDGRRRRDGLVNPVTAGTGLVVETTLEAVTPNRPGPARACSSHHRHLLLREGAVLNRNRRTVVLRNPLQES